MGNKPNDSEINNIVIIKKDNKIGKGIKNYGYNCYINAGLQILSKCDKFIEKLNNINNTNNKLIKHLAKTLQSIFNDEIEICEPINFIEHFLKNNKDFEKGKAGCSQNFIRTIIRNINEQLQSSQKNGFNINIYYNQKYCRQEEIIILEKFIENNKNFPESEIITLFSGIIRSHRTGFCCNNKINKYSFSYFLDLNIYLDLFSKDCKFSKILEQNLGTNRIASKCMICDRNIYLSQKLTFIKIPEILIFTLQRNADVKVESDEIIDLSNYINKNANIQKTKYELFAINIRFGDSRINGHEICEIKVDGQWYMFDDIKYKNITDKEGRIKEKYQYDNYSYGLFYKLIED